MTTPPPSRSGRGSLPAFDPQVLSVTLVRHGVTAWNREKRFQGHSDIELSPEGLDQTRRLARRLEAAGIPTKAVISSDLRRALATAEILARALRVASVQPDPAWRERRLGVFEGHTTAELSKVMAPAYRAWKQDPLDYAPPGGESYIQHRRRIAEALDAVRSRYPKGHVTVVTHGGCCYAALAICHGGDLPRDPTIKVQNTSLTHLSYRPRHGWEVLVADDHQHLGDGSDHHPRGDGFPGHAVM